MDEFVDKEPQGEPDPVGEETSAFGQWLQAEMAKKNMKISDLVARTGITYTGIWNIVRGNTISPRQETRDKLAAALNEIIPVDVQNQITEQSNVLPGYEWADFTPSDLQTVPPQPGVYVFYDVTGRPVYVGKSSKNVRTRVKDHQTRFWFKAPVVVRGAFLSVPDPDMCLKIETVLIKFLGRHALLNTQGVVRDLEDQ